MPKPGSEDGIVIEALRWGLGQVGPDPPQEGRQPGIHAGLTKPGRQIGIGLYRRQGQLLDGGKIIGENGLGEMGRQTLDEQIPAGVVIRPLPLMDGPQQAQALTDRIGCLGRWTLRGRDRWTGGNAPRPHLIRLMPALTITHEEIGIALDRLEESLP